MTTNTPETELLEQARHLLRQVAAQTDNPAVYQAVTIAEMNVHWARWQLGSVAEVMPQLEGS
jgi:hypothetical protein